MRIKVENGKYRITETQSSFGNSAEKETYMDQINLKILKEINPDPIRFSLQVKNRLKTMVHRMAQGYLTSMNYALQLEYTSSILLYIENSDFESLEDESPFFLLGNEKSLTGVAKIFLSERKLISIGDKDKRHLILKLIYSALINFVNQSKYSANVLQQAYDQYLSVELFYNSYPQCQSKDKKYTCQIQSRENWGSADYRLLVKYTVSDELKAYPIASIPYPFFDEMIGVTQENMWQVIHLKRLIR
jgi:hypothetical protein